MSPLDGVDAGGEPPCAAPRVDWSLTLTDGMLAGLVRALADAVLIADRDGTIVFWNAAAQRVFGWGADDAVGQSLDLIIPERLRERHWAGFRTTMTTGRTSYGDRLLQVPALHRDGRTLSIAFTVTLLREPGTTAPYAIAAIVRDETEQWQERRRLQAELAALSAARERNDASAD